MIGLFVSGLCVCFLKQLAKAVPSTASHALSVLPSSQPVVPVTLPVPTLSHPTFANAAPPPWPPPQSTPFTFHIPSHVQLPLSQASQPARPAAAQAVVPSGAPWPTMPASHQVATGPSLHSLRPYVSVVPVSGFGRVDVCTADADHHEAARRHQIATRCTPRGSTGSYTGLGASTQIVRLSNDPSAITVLVVLHAADVSHYLR